MVVGLSRGPVVAPRGREVGAMRLYPRAGSPHVCGARLFTIVVKARPDARLRPRSSGYEPRRTPTGPHGATP